MEVKTMPRIRQYAERDAMKDFVGEINAQRARNGYKTDVDFGRVIGVCGKTVWNYTNDPGSIRFSVLRAIVKAIRPDPGILLKALGYTTQDIKKLAKEYTS